MLHRKGRFHRQSFTDGSRQRSPVFLGILGALAIVACAPAADSAGSSSAPKVELEVTVATNCDAGADVVLEVGDATYTFDDLVLTGQANEDLPFSGTVRVPWSPDAPYRVTMHVGCDDSRVKEITTFRVDGDVRTLVGKTTASGRGVATFEEGM